MVKDWDKDSVDVVSLIYLVQRPLIDASDPVVWLLESQAVQIKWEFSKMNKSQLFVMVWG